MFCPNCGNSIPDDAKFCGECGSVISENESAPKKPKNSAFPPWIVAIIVILSLAVFGTAALLVYTIIEDNKDPASTESEASSAYEQFSSDEGSSDSESGNSSNNSSGTESEAKGKINPEYEKCYSDYGLTPPSVCSDFTDYDTLDTLVKIVEDTVDEYQIASKNGTVIAVCRRFYYTEDFIADYYETPIVTDAELDQLNNEILTGDVYISESSKSYVKVEFLKVDNSLCYINHASALDTPENCRDYFNSDAPCSRNVLIALIKDNGFLQKYID